MDSNDEKVLSVKAEDDPYMALFMQNMTLRPSCYNCPARAGSSSSDLTVADLWSVASSVPELDDDKGVSGVLVHSEKGHAYMAKIAAETMIELPVQSVMSQNGGFSESLPVPEKREEFFNGLGAANVDVYRHMKSYVIRKPLPLRIYRNFRSALSKLKRRMFR